MDKEQVVQTLRDLVSRMELEAAGAAVVEANSLPTLATEILAWELLWRSVLAAVLLVIGCVAAYFCVIAVLEWRKNTDGPMDPVIGSLFVTIIALALAGTTGLMAARVVVSPRVVLLNKLTEMIKTFD